MSILIILVAPTTCNLKSEIKSSSVNRLNGYNFTKIDSVKSSIRGFLRGYFINYNNIEEKRIF